MSQKEYQESPDDFIRRERRESMNAQPNWNDVEDSKAWLEERYPLLGDASLGSPLFRYMKACVEGSKQIRGRVPMFLASMLSLNETMRYFGETNITVGFDPTQETLYPDSGIPDQDSAPEPDWSDRAASRTWLEQRYPVGRPAIGSPLYRYMLSCRESRHPMSSPITRLGSMLTNSEWRRFCGAYPNSSDRDEPKRFLLYSEYDNRRWPAPGPGPQSTYKKALPPPAAKPALFVESYPPHLRRQSPSSSPSNKRKGDDGDDASPEHPANKRRRNPSDLSGGVVTSAKLLNPYEENDIPRQPNDIGSMPPPPRPQQKAAGTMDFGQQRKNKEESRPSRQGTFYMTGTTTSPAHRTIEAEIPPRVLNLSRQSFEKQTAGAARQNDQSVETPKIGGPVHTSTVATKPPALGHSSPIFSNPEPQHDDQLAFLGEESETDAPGHQPHGQHTVGSTIQSVNDKNAAHEKANKNTSPIRPDPQHENQAHVEVSPDAMDIDSDDPGHQTSASPTNIPLVDPSRKRHIEHVEDEQPAGSLTKKRRESTDTGRDESFISNRLFETPLADSSRKSSIENVEVASSPSSSPKRTQIPSNSGGDESPVPSLTTETRLADPSRKRSIEDVEDALPTTSSSKRQRTPPKSGGNELPPSSPFHPPERSTPIHFPRLVEKTAQIGTRGERPDPAPLRTDTPPYEGPTKMISRPNDLEGPALQSGSQSEPTGGGRNPETTNTDDQPTANLRDHEVTINGRDENQEPSNDGLVLPDPEPLGKHHVHIEEDPDDMIIESEHPNDQRKNHAIQQNGKRTEQTAISVVIPLQIPQRQPAANEKKHKGRGQSGTNGRKAPQSEPQKRKPPTKGRKNRQLKPKREEQAYVGRLRSGVGERTHRKPRLVVLEFKGRKAVQVRAN